MNKSPSVETTELLVIKLLFPAVLFVIAGIFHIQHVQKETKNEQGSFIHKKRADASRFGSGGGRISFHNPAVERASLRNRLEDSRDSIHASFGSRRIQDSEHFRSANPPHLKNHVAQAAHSLLFFSVFFSSMFVTNDVSLIIFVPLTILMLQKGGKEKYIIPVLTFENIAAIRGSLLMPFGSPQNLYLFSKSGIPVQDFLLMMLPLWLGSAAIMYLFILFLYRKDLGEKLEFTEKVEENNGDRKKQVVYITLLAAVIFMIVTRSRFWPFFTAGVFVALLIFDRKILLKTDYVLLLTFFCFFVFSSSICRNPKISQFLSESVAGNEYWWSILLSQVISNVPASIVLWPFSTNLKALLYGLDSAGLCSIIGSLASVINLRIYSRAYPGKTLSFIKGFQIISIIFFAIVVLPQLLLLKL